MRALLHLLETITIRIRSHAENDPSPKETQTETMVGPSQAFALLLRVLFAWHANPTGSVRRRLRQRFSASRTAQLLLETNQCSPQSAQHPPIPNAEDRPNIVHEGSSALSSSAATQRQATPTPRQDTLRKKNGRPVPTPCHAPPCAVRVA